VERTGTTVIDEVLAYKENGFTEDGLTSTKTLYLDLSSLVGVECLGGALYDVCIYLYQYKYDECMERYQKYGYAYLKRDAENYQIEHDALKNGIGKANFTTVMKCGFAFADLMLGEGLQTAQIATFTDAEILTFIQHLGLSSLTISEDGWRLILYHTIPKEGGMYAAKVARTMKEYDLPAGAQATMMGVELLSNAIEKMEERDAAY
jgi:hypothetical protein